MNPLCPGLVLQVFIQLEDSALVLKVLHGSRGAEDGQELATWKRPVSDGQLQSKQISRQKTKQTIAKQSKQKKTKLAKMVKLDVNRMSACEEGLPHSRPDRSSARTFEPLVALLGDALRTNPRFLRRSRDRFTVCFWEKVFVGRGYGFGMG